VAMVQRVERAVDHCHLLPVLPQIFVSNNHRF
jgi:hypothetical protein